MNISRFKDGLEELISNYSIDRYGRDWDYCFGLSFKYEVKNFNNCRRLMKKLWKRIKKECLIDGVYVMEYGKRGKIYVHGLMICDLHKGRVEDLFKKYWGSGGGIFWLDKFDSDKVSHDLYMIKDNYENDLFDYDIISNLY
tara:strand:+ start:227 stop:649 length:423 start_codon:yes stop_codon:yes gene_type:complete